MPPSEYRNITKDDLRQKYLDGGWPERLRQYHCEERKYGNHKTCKTWWDGVDLMAEVREYGNPGEGGQQVVVCQLREGDIMWFVP